MAPEFSGHLQVQVKTFPNLPFHHLGNPAAELFAKEFASIANIVPSHQQSNEVMEDILKLKMF